MPTQNGTKNLDYAVSVLPKLGGQIPTAENLPSIQKIGEGSSGYNPIIPLAISSDTLNSTQSPLNVKAPGFVAPYPVSSIAVPELTATEPEKQAGSLIDSLKALNESYVGQSAYRAQQETAQGIPDLLKTQRELASRVTTLQKEAQAIPLQLQEQFSGTGATTGGVAPIQASMLRKNAIQALSTSALLEATNGNITLAQNLVDRAVAQKYDPIKEEIDAKTANLNLILKSPEYSLADKNRAAKQQAIVDAQKMQLEKNKEDAKTIASWASAAIANGATPYEAQQIMNIANSDNPDLNSAFQIYSKYAVDPNAVKNAILEQEYKRSQIAVNNANASKVRAETGQVTGGGISDPIGKNTPLINAFNNAAIGLTAAQLKSAQTTFNNLLSKGDTEGAKSLLVRVATTGLPAADQTAALGRTQAIGALQEIQSLLSQANADGSKTGLIQGSIQDVAERLGNQGDKNLAYIGSRINTILQVYRRAMTGVAFSPVESAQYEKLFPSLKKNFDLNTTKIQGLLDALDSSNRATVGFVIGDSNYNSIFGASNLQLPSNNQPNNTVLMTGPDGQDYYVPQDQVSAFIGSGGKRK